MIYYDHTEGAKGSALPSIILDKGEKIIGLEAQTGADILITPDALPDNVSAGLGLFRLNKAVNNGVLIQRKTGSDLMGSIPKLTEIAGRMQAAKPIAFYLATIGKYTASADGKIIVNGRKTGWGLSGYVMALDAWQIAYGGALMQFDDDATFVEWLLQKDRQAVALSAANNKEPIEVRKGSSIVVSSDPRIAVLTGFPNIGEKMARAILEYVGGDLAWALVWLSLEDETIPGVGRNSKQLWRSTMGLEDGHRLIHSAKIPLWMQMEED